MADKKSPSLKMYAKNVKGACEVPAVGMRTPPTVISISIVISKSKKVEGKVCSADFLRGLTH